MILYYANFVNGNLTSPHVSLAFISLIVDKFTVDIIHTWDIGSYLFLESHEVDAIVLEKLIVGFSRLHEDCKKYGISQAFSCSYMGLILVRIDIKNIKTSARGGVQYQ